jgi:hypothetical protein
MDAQDRDRRDAAGVGPYARERERLVPMSSLVDWKLSKGEPDIRGWEIRTVSGRQLGVVADLLVDREAGEAVMLDVDLPGTDRHACVPIRVAKIDRASRIILMDSAELTAADQPAPPPDRAVPLNAAPPPVADPHPAVDPPMRRRDSERRVDEPRSDTSYNAAAPESAAQRRQAERRRIDRMGTDL